MCSKNTSHLEASPQEARITLAGDTFSASSDFHSCSGRGTSRARWNQNQE
eukprot:bmy_08539T0